MANNCNATSEPNNIAHLLESIDFIQPFSIRVLDEILLFDAWHAAD
jgi:hypothetical protein